MWYPRFKQSLNVSQNVNVKFNNDYVDNDDICCCFFEREENNLLDASIRPHLVQFLLQELVSNGQNEISNF